VTNFVASSSSLSTPSLLRMPVERCGSPAKAVVLGAITDFVWCIRLFACPSVRYRQIAVGDLTVIAATMLAHCCGAM
jgi:hypothetical protein